jgi:cytoskeletal protein RodZ
MIILRTQMNPKTTPLVLAMFFILVCTLPAAGATVPAAIAQEDITSLDEEDLARSIISDVLDGGDDEVNDEAADDEIDDQDSTDTSTVNPNQEDQTVDQTDFNEYGDNTATNLDADRQTESNVAVSIDVNEEQGGGVVLCYQRQGDERVCFNTQEQCELALAEDELSTTSHCERFETLPPDAFLCVASEGGISCIRE